MSKTNPPSIFGSISEFTEGSDWDIYVERLDEFYKCNEVKDDDKKRSMLLTACGEYLYSLIRTLCQPNKPCDTSFDDVIKVVTNHLKPKPSEIVRRCVFHATSRTTNESVANFANRLRKLAEHCNFGTVLDVSLRDRFVCGINDDRIQRRLLVETTLDFKTAFNLAVASEASNKGMDQIRSTTQSSASFVHNTKEERKEIRKHEKKESPKYTTGKCKGCNGNHTRSKCPFLKQKCHSCQKVGHIAKVCRLKTKSQASNKLDECEETDLFSLQTSKCDNKFLVDLKVGAEIVNFEVDTGSARTVISERTFESWKQKPKVNLKGVANFVDDIVPSGKTEQEHLENLRKVFEVMRKNGVHANKKKCKFGVSRISYIGHDFVPGGVMPSVEKVKAIKKAPEPKNVTQLKSYLGGLGYYGRFMPNLSSVVEKLYKLTQKDVPWKWTKVERTAFQKSKDLLLSDAVLTNFIESEDLYMVCDASEYGIGVILEHRVNSKRKPICFWSRILSKAERNYSQLEKESLAIIYGLFKAYEYVYGRLVYIVTDHKPLLALLGENKPIPEVVSPRVIRWAIRLSAFNYVLIYSKGADIGNADALSRLPVDPPPQNKQDVEHVLMLTENSKIVDFKEVKEFTRRDLLLCKVKQFTLSYWPSNVDEDLKPFLRRKDEICIVRDCVLWGERIIIPRKLQSAVLGLLHEGHPGVVRMKCNARSHVWWPSINMDIESMVAKCVACQAHRNMPQKVPTHPRIWPKQPWIHVHADIGTIDNSNYLILIDTHSKWMEVHYLHRTTSKFIIGCLRQMCATHGIFEEITTDNGPQFVSIEFEEWCKRNNVRHSTSTPYHPASNGIAERAVQTFKQGFKKQSVECKHTRLQRFLFNYRNTVHTATGETPSQMLFRRKLRTPLDNIKPSSQESAQEKYKRSSDRHARDRNFEEGDDVQIRTFEGNEESWSQAKIISQSGVVTYDATLANGKTVRRHADQIVRTEPPVEKTSETPHVDESEIPLSDVSFKEQKSISNAIETNKSEMPMLEGPFSSTQPTPKKVVYNSPPKLQPMVRRTTRERKPIDRFDPSQIK
ncbi:uncharacterized protein B4U80_01971, partial [Leptotrombidium deliense]